MQEKYSSEFEADMAILDDLNDVEDLEDDSYNNYQGIADEEDEQVESKNHEELTSDDEIDSESQEELLKPIMKKTKLKPKKGRRSTWDEEMVDDLVNIICEDD